MDLSSKGSASCNKRSRNSASNCSIESSGYASAASYSSDASFSSTELVTCGNNNDVTNVTIGK